MASTMESKANAGPASAATGRAPAATFPAVLATETRREHYDVRIRFPSDKWRAGSSGGSVRRQGPP